MIAPLVDKQESAAATPPAAASLAPPPSGRDLAPECDERSAEQLCKRIEALEAENRALRDRDERYRLMLKAAWVTQWDCDLGSGRVLVQIGDGQPVERSVDDWKRNLHPDDRPRMAGAYDRLVRGKADSFAEQYRYRTPDGYVLVYDRGYAITGADGAPTRAVGGATDLTQLHDAQSKLEQIRTELIHVSRLSAMGTMASTLAHELNQPLAAIVNYVHAAGRMAGRDVRLREALAAAECSATRAGEIVRRLRELAAKRGIERRSEPVLALIHDAATIALPDAPALGIEHSIDIAPDLPDVIADRVQVQQVIINLLRNAVDAVRNAERREIGIAAKMGDACVEIAVCDSGAGVPETLLSQLFAPFVTTKPDGLGIGLSISRTIVEAHRGKIGHADRPGGGSRFSFTLPVATATAAQSSE